MHRRRRQVRAAGTTNRLVDKDPRSQPSVSVRQSRKDRGLHPGTAVASATPCHLPPRICPAAPTPQAKDCFPCPCTATIGEEAGNAPSGVPFACSASCTSFEKSSLLSSRVPPPDTRYGLFERRPRQLETELFNNQRSFQEEFSQLKQALLSEAAHASAADSMSASRRAHFADENGQFFDMGPGQGPIIRTVTPYNATAHTVRPYRSHYAPLRAAID